MLLNPNLREGDLYLIESYKLESERNRAIGVENYYNVQVWFDFVAHQPLEVLNAKSIFIHIASFISNNSV